VRLGTRAVGPTLVALLLASPLGAQSIFERIPAFTSVCYGEQDNHWTELNDLRDSLQAEVYAGEEANLALRRSLDPGQRQQQLMAAMQSNPQRAMEMMQMQQTLATDGSAFAAAELERGQAFDAEAGALMDEYQAELRAKTATIDDRIAVLSEPGGPAGGPDELPALYRQWDAEYAALCSTWFGSDGRFAEFLSRFRSYLVDEWLPESRRLNDLLRENEEFFAGVERTRWAYLGEHEAAIRHMDFAMAFAGLRESTRRDATRGAIGQ
jgi:hypothetical protein